MIMVKENNLILILFFFLILEINENNNTFIFFLIIKTILDQNHNIHFFSFSSQIFTPPSLSVSHSNIIILYIIQNFLYYEIRKYVFIFSPPILSDEKEKNLIYI